MNTFARRLALSLLAACLSSPVLAADALSLEPGMDRMGSDYDSLALDQADPQLCRAACAADLKCKAYTYVKPGVQGPQAVCFLKSSAAPASASDCCVSGLRNMAPGSVAIATAPRAMAAIPVTMPGIDANADLKKQLIAQGKLIAAQQALLATQQDALAELNSLVASTRNELQALTGTVAANQKAYGMHKHTVAHVRNADGTKQGCNAAALAGQPKNILDKCAEAQLPGHTLQLNGYFADEIGTDGPHN